MEVARALTRPVHAIEAIRDHFDEPFQIERLENRIADRVRRDFLHAALSCRGKHDDVRPVHREFLRDRFDEFVSVDLRHHEIEENEIEAAIAPEFIETDQTVFGQLDIEFHAFENRLKEDANGQVVVDDQNLPAGSVDSAGHGPPSHPFAKDVPS